MSPYKKPETKSKTNGLKSREHIVLIIEQENRYSRFFIVTLVKAIEEAIFPFAELI